MDLPLRGGTSWKASGDTHHEQEDSSDTDTGEDDLSAADSCHEEEGVDAADHTKGNTNFDHHGNFRGGQASENHKVWSIGDNRDTDAVVEPVAVQYDAGTTPVGTPKAFEEGGFGCFLTNGFFRLSKCMNVVQCRCHIGRFSLQRS